MARKLENSSTYDSGAQIRDAVKIVRTEGAVSEEVWPYKSGEFSADPPDGYASAPRYKVKRAEKIKGGIDQIKVALADKGPVVAGITVYQSVFSDSTRNTGVVTIPKLREKVIGGHAVCVVVYNDSNNLLKFINSWGKDWGDHGYGYLPYEYIAGNSGDIWTMTL